LLAVITISIADAQSVATNAVSTDFSKALINLQNDIQQLLPMLAALNNSTFLSNSNLSSALSGTPGTFTNAYTFGQQLPAYGAQSASDSSLRTNIIISTLPGGSTVTTLADTPETPSSINGTNISTLMAMAHYRLFGALGTNGTVLNATEQENLRSLILLQSDLERALTLVKSLNSRYELPPK
jgi:hypothetical protein